MTGDIPKVNVAVKDRILLHLLEEDEQADRYVVSAALTRPGIAEACAQHPPNVSRAMRTLLRKRMVSEHSRAIRGDERMDLGKRIILDLEIRLLAFRGSPQIYRLF